MTHPLSPCNENCPSPLRCFDNSTCATINLDTPQSIGITDEFACVENYRCPTAAMCHLSKLCQEQMHLSSQTTWYRHITYLRQVIGDHQIWLLSGNIGDDCIVKQWIQLEVVPTADEKQRLHIAQQCVESIADLRGQDIARGWFVGRNVAGMYAYEAFRKDRFDLIEESANKHVRVRA
jgi:hypothetical protein